MFDVLKKKIGGFVNKLIKKEEEKPEAPKEEPEAPEEKPEIPVERPPEKIEAPPKPVGKKPEVKPAEKPRPVPKEVPKPVPEKPKPEVKPKPVPVEKKKPEPIEEKKPEVKPEPVKEIPKPPEVKPEPVKEIPKEVPKPLEPKREIRKPPEPEEKKKVKLSVVSAVKSLISKEVEIQEADVKELFDSLELELLEGDVSLEVSQEIIERLRSELIGARVEKGKLDEAIKAKIRSTLADVMEGEKIDLVEFVRSREKPVKMVFLGINGAGKTTTIAKIAKMLMDNGMTVVFAASDTFRAAAIEQIGVHADRLGVKVIKRDYGSDPTSVAFDAVNYAKAHGIDAVLIDTAGRQDTNINLINELKKMDRVLKPDLKIYIGESIAGNALMEQVASFNREIGVDGVILTKLDCDAKGGTILSVAHTTGVPVIYIGTGQKYEDIEIFDAGKIAERIVG